VFCSLEFLCIHERPCRELRCFPAPTYGFPPIRLILPPHAPLFTSTVSIIVYSPPTISYPLQAFDFFSCPLFTFPQSLCSLVFSSTSARWSRSPLCWLREPSTLLLAGVFYRPSWRFSVASEVVLLTNDGDSRTTTEPPVRTVHTTITTTTAVLTTSTGPCTPLAMESSRGWRYSPKTPEGALAARAASPNIDGILR
jgi:hypothetical protein